MWQDDEHVDDDYQGGTSALTQACAGTRAAVGPVAVQGLGGDLRIACDGPTMWRFRVLQAAWLICNGSRGFDREYHALS
jgi:hypothetical protein